MIKIFEEDETEFTSLGLGVLVDALSCTVTETLNDEYEVTINYPIEGLNYSELKVNRIVYCKPNPYSAEQPFRIYSISKPLNGIVTVQAQHISYDLNGLVVKSLAKGVLRVVLDEIQNGSLTKCNFDFSTDIITDKTYELTAPANARSLLMGSDTSLLSTYDCELYFDKFRVNLLKKRGENRGVIVRYGKNLVDLTNEINYDTLYNGVYPYYHTESSTQDSIASVGTFTQVYIVGSKPLQAGWLSYKSGGEAYTPISPTPVQIASEGDYYGKVYSWDASTQRYILKIYNESITLIQGAIAPSWIYIDWSAFPKVSCKATKDGYFKTATDTDWGKLKKANDTIFEGSIIGSSILSSIIIFYSEVIPDTTSATTNNTTEKVHIELPDKIIWVNTDAAKELKINRILPLDLTSEFSNSPSEDELRAKALKYIDKNKIGSLKVSTTLSFVDLSATTGGSNEIIELGDEVLVQHERLGVNILLRVMSYSYDVIKNKYSKITLGEKEENISGNSVQTGDKVSSLSNDAGYADTTTVKKLIADTVNANYILARNAKLTEAQIDELSTARINCTGIVEASQFSIDTLVAKLLIADNAQIAQTLTAGKISVAGNIDILSGTIAIESSDSEETYFRVDKNGNLYANSVTITGGELDIGDGMFSVTNDGILFAADAQIRGTIEAKDGSIGNFTIANGSIYNGIEAFNTASPIGVYIGTDGIQLGNNFSVTSAGALKSKSGVIGGFTINATSLYSGNIGSDNSVCISQGTTTAYKLGNIAEAISGWVITAGSKFGVTQNGAVYASDVYLSGKIDMTSGSIAIKKDGIVTFSVSNEGEIQAVSGTVGGFTLTSTSLYSGAIQSWADVYSPTDNGILLTSDGIRIGNLFKISKDGSMTVNGDSTSTGLKIFADGKVQAKSVDLTGKIGATSGYIGTAANGFTISDIAIYNKITGLEKPYEYDIQGVYVGTDGIRVGPQASIDTDTDFYEIQTSTTTETEIDLPEDNQEYEVNFWLAHSGGTLYIRNADYTILYNATITGAEQTWSSVKFSTEVGESPQTIYVSYSITGGLTNMTITRASKPGFVVTSAGKLYAMDAYLSGNFKIKSGSLQLGTLANGFTINSDGSFIARKGKISDFTIDNYGIHTGVIGAPNSISLINNLEGGLEIGGSDARDDWVITAGANFGVTKNGDVYATSAHLFGDDAVTSIGTATYLVATYGGNRIYKNDATVSIKQGGVVSTTVRTNEDRSVTIDSETVHIDSLGHYIVPITSGDLAAYPRVMFFGLKNNSEDYNFKISSLSTGIYFHDATNFGFTSIFVAGKSVFQLSKDTIYVDGADLMLITPSGAHPRYYSLRETFIAGNPGIVGQTLYYGNYGKPIMVCVGATENGLNTDVWQEVATINKSDYTVIDVITSLSKTSKNATGYGGSLSYVDSTTDPNFYHIWVANDGDNNKRVNFMIFYLQK